MYKSRSLCCGFLILVIGTSLAARPSVAGRAYDGTQPAKNRRAGIGTGILPGV
jgi:hypothetical protein